jgi:hypothetical protein
VPAGGIRQTSPESRPEQVDQRANSSQHPDLSAAQAEVLVIQDQEWEQKCISGINEKVEGESQSLAHIFYCS